MKLKWLLFLFLLNTASIDAQELFSNHRTKVIPLTLDTIQLDTLSIVPGSVVLTDDSGAVLPSGGFSINPENGLLILSPQFLSDSSLKMARFTASYSVFPFLFSKSYQHKDSKVLKPNESGKINPFIYTGEEKKNSEFFTSEGLNKSGSITRGVAFGNNQDVVVNSNLNLQLSGKLTDKIEILAAIADDNIPIQPEGNTQQLQEFDRVYIQFKDAKSQLIAGDFQLTRPNSYFMNYFKKSQGASFSSTFGLGKTIEKQKNNSMSVSLSAAVSKGKFSRNLIPGVEGNQGPYRLNGAENEAYIIILSGSEKIYIDGQLLVRGQENDYVIDYNTAEITFTPKRKITKDKRITAEFQYSDKNYARSLYELGNEYKNKKLALRFHVFSEQDNKKKPLLQDLKTSEKQVLAAIGDSLQNAVVPSIDTTGYLPNTILYKAVDTLGYNNVYVYSTDSTNAFFRLSFTNVGLGNGNYNPVNTSANGKVYQWVAPLAGVKQGAYEPVVLLITPKKRQLVTLGADYQIARNFSSTLELAYSNYDKNTFSNLASKDDEGYGIRVGLLKKTPLSSTERDTLHLVSGATLEFVSNYFSPIERYRPVEFERDWNRGSSAINNAQTLASAKIGIEKKSVGNAFYQLNSFKELGNYSGVQHRISSDATKQGYTFSSAASLLNSNNGNSIKTSYLKYKALLSKKISIVTIGAGVEQEESKFFSKKDSLFANSFHFIEWQAFAKSADTAKTSFGLKYLNRTDWLSDSGAFSKTSRGQSIEAGLGFAKNENSVLRISATYRTLEIKNQALSPQKPDNSLVSRIEYDLKLFKGVISSSTFYEVGSGLEVKKEYSFIKVQPGQGVYQWLDLNNDSIQGLDEFVEATFKDKAEYLKVFTPTSEFVKTYNNQFNEIINLNPSRIWSNKKGIRKFISLFSNQTAYRIDRKTSNNDAEKYLNPFLNETKDAAIVTLNSAFRNTFIFNRFNSKFGFDYSYLENKNKSLLVNGTEQRSTISNILKARWNITRKWLLTNDASLGTKSNTVQFFSSRNFRILIKSTEPTISFQPTTTFRLSVTYQYSEKKNVRNDSDSLREQERALGQKIGTELKYSKAQKGSLSAKFNYVFFNYNGAANSSISYEMLEGLQPGKNYTWNLIYQQTLANNIQLNLSYDGRKSGSNKIVHVGNVQVRAFF